MSADATDAELDAADAEANASDAGTQAVDSDADGDEFPAPPRTFTDGDGRVLRLRASDAPAAEAGGASAGESGDERNVSPDHHEELAAMYDTFESGDRAQGIPPANPRRRGDWLDRLHEGIEVVAYHDDAAVGHGILLDGGPGHELALFVHPDYRGAGVTGASAPSPVRRVRCRSARTRPRGRG